MPVDPPAGPPTPPPGKRQIIQIATVQTERSGVLIMVLLSDGTIWGTARRNTEWEEWPGPP